MSAPGLVDSDLGYLILILNCVIFLICLHSLNYLSPPLPLKKDNNNRKICVCVFGGGGGGERESKQSLKNVPGWKYAVLFSVTFFPFYSCFWGVYCCGQAYSLRHLRRKAKECDCHWAWTSGLQRGTGVGQHLSRTHQLHHLWKCDGGKQADLGARASSTPSHPPDKEQIYFVVIYHAFLFSLPGSKPNTFGLEWKTKLY